MTKSKISDSNPLEKLFACVSNISLATALSLTTTNFFGPIARTNISPYAKNSLYSGTKTGCPAISRMSPLATGIFDIASARHRLDNLASASDTPRPTGPASSGTSPRSPSATFRNGPVDDAFVNSPLAMRSSSVSAFLSSPDAAARVPARARPGPRPAHRARPIARSSRAVAPHRGIARRRPSSRARPSRARRPPRVVAVVAVVVVRIVVVGIVATAASVGARARSSAVESTLESRARGRARAGASRGRVASRCGAPRAVVDSVSRKYT